MAIRLQAKKITSLFIRKLSNVSNEIVSSVSEIFLVKPIGDLRTVKGWIKETRKMGKVVFFNLTDGSCISSLQIVCYKENLKEPLNWGSSVSVTGKIQITPEGQVELLAEKLSVIGKCDVTDNFPFTPKQKQPYEYYRQYLHFRPKIEYFTCLLRFRSAVTHKIHNYFNENSFTQIHTPIITSLDCEGAGETFNIRPESTELIRAMQKKNVPCENAFFNSQAFLTVSGQLHLEAVTRSISKVYTFNPSFRAENSKSRLHLSEFYMVEAEEAFVTDLKIILKRIEDLVKQLTVFLLSKYLYDIEYMLKHNETNLKKHINVLEKLIDKPFSVMKFAEAKSKINNNQDKIKRTGNNSPNSLTKEEELFLVENNDNIPVFVVDWPKFEKPFYMKESSEDHDLVQGVDLLVPNVGELCGGSLREDNYDVLLKKLSQMKTLESMKWYLDLRKFGNVPTGGFGLGFERFLQFFLNIQNIKDTIPFPRWPHNLQL